MNAESDVNFSPCCGGAEEVPEAKCDQNSRDFSSPRFSQCAASLTECMLSELAVGDSGTLVALALPDEVQNHLMHMGFVPDARVKVLRHAPAGDPIIYAIDGMEVALRKETAAAIRVRPAEAQPEDAR